ncbi:MAG: monovalent cation/H(+) antiporter subunit G [Rickettsiales bacterium]|nr:monovalent cation/H(+) antiporter subunit G [Pseudomonadota bacterium]MDA0967266.1 monovalent cation/H(+) antiporter subunit G [Pseudomonadota bacterium]MDG4544073.1 monovalent cation/H(+) antiporter subunit G [Rickettsiales bacterium]MDG4546233.1 monovalent cation/H(+) antiporter subunit G [Rickettsiales bacterium]MDG4548397.1 monovalent cation/H(+) antiporter subunit G [Rickettsiales bacterium]
MEDLPNIIGMFFVISGAFFMFSAAVGVLRMPDFYTRLHPAGVADSLGAPFVLVGIAILNGATLFSGKIIFLILFMLITSPTACHALAKAAVYSGLKPYKSKRRKK